MVTNSYLYGFKVRSVATQYLPQVLPDSTCTFALNFSAISRARIKFKAAFNMYFFDCKQSLQTNGKRRHTASPSADSILLQAREPGPSALLSSRDITGVVYVRIHAVGGSLAA